MSACQLGNGRCTYYTLPNIHGLWTPSERQNQMGFARTLLKVLASNQISPFKLFSSLSKAFFNISFKMVVCNPLPMFWTGGQNEMAVCNQDRGDDNEVV